MIKIFLVFLILVNILFAAVKDIEKKIDTKKEEFSKAKKTKSQLDNIVNNLAKTINNEEQVYSKIVKNLEKTNTTLFLNKLKLDRAKDEVARLKKTAISLEDKKKQIEKDTIDFVIKQYSMSLGLEQAKKESLQELIDKEAYTIILENVKQELVDLNIDYLKVNRNKRVNQDKIGSLQKFIQKQEEVKSEYLDLKKKQESILASLEVKHKEYQKSLQKIIDKQNKLTDLLGTLNILKKKEIQKEQLRIKQEKLRLAKEKKELERKRKLAQKKKAKTKNKAKVTNKVAKKEKPTKQMKILSKKDLDENINLEVRKIGSSAKGIKIAKYRGKKTIAPLKSYIITKKFGTYYDKVYKMKLFNESVSMKTKIPNAKVHSVLKGQVVYFKNNAGLLDNVVIVKHKGNLHTIYSHLDKIAPTLKVGKWIPKGYVVGRVNDTLQFQATKDSKYIDPTKLFK